MEKKKCPIIERECVKDDCEFFDKSIRGNRCSIRSIAYSLRILANSMDDDESAIRVMEVLAEHD